MNPRLQSRYLSEKKRRPCFVRPTPPKILDSVIEEIPTESKPHDDTLSGMEKCKQLYDIIQQDGKFLTSSLDLHYGENQRVPIDEAGNQEMVISEEMYNAPLTFTILNCVLPDSAMIYFGKPGLGKTTLPEYVSSMMFDIPMKDIQQATIYGHPQLTEEKMVAMYDVVKLLQGERELIQRDFTTCAVKIIDEINRIPPATLSILYQLVDRGWTTYQNETIFAKPGPLFATANPADSGNFDLPEPFLDRFPLGVTVQHLNPYHYEDFLGGKKETPFAMYAEDRGEVARQIQNVTIDSNLVSKLAHFSGELMGCDMAGSTPDTKLKSNALYNAPPCDTCEHFAAEGNICSSTENGLSTRAINSIIQVTKGLAAWRNHSEADMGDLTHAITYTTWFKLRPTKDAFRDPVWSNDRQEWVKSLLKTSLHSFEETSHLFPMYRDISANMGSEWQAEHYDECINVIKQIDSLAKYPLISALRQKHYVNRSR